MTRIPRRASRYLSRWQRFKRWWRLLWYRGTIIYFDEAPKKGVDITFTYTGSVEERHGQKRTTE